jgi:hypothetical protein
MTITVIGPARMEGWPTAAIIDEPERNVGMASSR